MLTRHVTRSLAQYADGELPAAQRGRVEAHLARCPRCSAELEAMQFSARLVRQLSAVPAPPAIWHRLDTALSSPPEVVPFQPFVAVRWASAFVLLIAFAAAGYWWTREATPRPWEVRAADDGSSRRMAAGEWVETGHASTARILVGSLGTVDVEPGTRVKLGEVTQSEYRMALTRGTISAQIAAPPRLFIVDTPTSTVVDLGCAYTVTVGDDGTAVLRMTSGWAALEWKGRESLVPAGAICRTRAGAGPGTPYFDDAPAAVKRAVEAFDAGRGASEALDILIREARVRDTLTLWHLLSRIDVRERTRVYERMAELVPPPASVSRDQVLALDADTLREWREELAWQW